MVRVTEVTTPPGGGGAPRPLPALPPKLETPCPTPTILPQSLPGTCSEGDSFASVNLMGNPTAYGRKASSRLSCLGEAGAAPSHRTFCSEQIKSASIPWAPPVGRQGSCTCACWAAQTGDWRWLQAVLRKTATQGHTRRKQKIRKEFAFNSASMSDCVIQNPNLHFTIKHVSPQLEFKKVSFGRLEHQPWLVSNNPAIFLEISL